jgi:glycosyltransferase involved in cell wall biosynthesis
MKILMYTQARTVGGGSGTLLMNLAKHLARRHTVTFAFMNAHQKDDFNSVARFEHNYVWTSDLMSQSTSIHPDVMVCHFPYYVDNIAFLKGLRKVAVIMEVPGFDRVPVNSNNYGLFEHVIFLNDAQVANIPEAESSARFHKLGIIDDIDYAPVYRKTGDVGCIKNDFSTLHTVIRRSPEAGCFKVYYGHSRILRNILNSLCSAHSSSYNTQPLSTLASAMRELFDSCGRRLAGGGVKKALQFSSVCHRIRVMGFERTIEKLFDSFDCLLRTPQYSIGASLSVQDALACGKPVVLSDIPGHRTAYSRFKGVSFVNEIDYCLDGLLRSYDVAAFNEIRDCYMSVYDRQMTLSQWEEIIAS